MLKILGLYVKGLQNCQLSNFKNYLTPGRLQIGLNALAHTLAGMAESADLFLKTPTLIARNIAALWPTDPKFLALKDLLFFLRFNEFQGADSILKVGFALSNWPHFHRVYLVTIYNQNFIAVSWIFF